MSSAEYLESFHCARFTYLICSFPRSLDGTIDADAPPAQQQDFLESLARQIAFLENAVVSLRVQLDALSNVSRGAALQDLNALNQEITHHIRAATSLKTRWNGLLPISCIPPEILGHIFAHVVHICLNFYSLRDGVKLGLVCRAWREVAYATPELWSNLEGTRYSINKLQKLLIFSKQAPLSINLDTSYSASDPDHQKLQVVINDLWRARSLKMSYPSSTYEEYRTHFPTSVPFLRSLTLTRPRQYNDWGIQIQDAPDATMVPWFLRWSMLHLSGLELNYYCVDWSAPMFRNSLTQLKVVCTAVEVTPQHTVSSIIKVVQGLPQLECLVLEGCVYPAASSDTLLPTSPSSPGAAHHGRRATHHPLPRPLHRGTIRKTTNHCHRRGSIGPRPSSH